MIACRVSLRSQQEKIALFNFPVLPSSPSLPLLPLPISPSPPQERCLQSGVVSLCLGQLEEPNAVLKQWLAICLGRLWQKFDPARWYGARDNAHEKLIALLWDEIPDVSGCGLM